MIYLVQNDPRVPPGYFGELLTDWNVDHETVHACAGESWPSTERGDGIVVLGGYMGVGEQKAYPHLGMIVEALSGLAGRHLPVLGICLGAQLLARALGASVHDDFLGERGTGLVYLNEEADGDPLLAGLPSPLHVVQWHRDSFELPEGAKRLGWSPRCPNQIFRYGCSYGVQFHPEVNTAILSDWVQYKKAPRYILERFVADREEYRQVAQRMMTNFLALCEKRRVER